MAKNPLITVLALAGLVTAGSPVRAADQALPPRGFAGDFLASHFAQSEYDWKNANDYLDDVLKKDPGNYDLLKRSMILAMGSGNLDLAAKRAGKLLEIENDNNL